jgi:protein-S-isoprenylcysteine O-methyltransferase Ste14
VKIETWDNKRRIVIAQSLVSIQFGILAILALSALIRYGIQSKGDQISSLVFIAFGVIVLLLAYKSLKPSLSISPIPISNAPFINSGIYRYTRHPMYFGALLIGFGLTGLANNWPAWILMTALLLALNIKGSFEDALLNEIHPEARHYQLHTSKIVPCLGNTCRTNCGE